MTEREYVEAIRRVAQAYTEQIREPKDPQPVRHWEAIKQKLSPWTAIDLCDAWLKTYDAIAAEREGCARIIDHLYTALMQHAPDTERNLAINLVQAAADAIRGRGDTDGA